MVFLIDKKYIDTIERYLNNCQYTASGEGTYVRNRYTDRQFPIYRLSFRPDDMNHFLLVTLTMETLPEKRKIKDARVVFHKGTILDEERARLSKILA